MSETHYVQPGEYMELIAKNYGFPGYQTILKDPKNQAFKKRRPNPDILLPGDPIFIPDKDPADKPADTDKKTKFVIKAAKISLTVNIRHNGEPFKHQKYTLKVGTPQQFIDKQTKTFTDATNAEGLIITKEIAVPEALGVLVGVLTFARLPSYSRKLNLGFLHPITVASGVQMRLNNLGFGCGPPNGALTPAYTVALQAYQRKHNLPNQTGTLDDNTIDALRHEYEQDKPS